MSYPQSHAARAATMTIEALRFSLAAQCVITPAGRHRPALRGETRALETELARRISAEARAGGE